MNKDTEKLVTEYVNAEGKLIKNLNSLKNGKDGKECDCEEPDETIEIIDADEPMIVKRCLKCGGFLVP